jgi:hypothetical protein
MQSARRALIRVALLVTMVGFAGSLAAQASEEVTSPADAKAREAWRKTMHHTPAPKQGCFHASYPGTQWQEVQCAPPPGYRSARPLEHNQKKGSQKQVGGPHYPGNDIVVQASSGHLLSNAEGSFLSVSGVKSETGVGVDNIVGGTLGANEYTLQLNTNISNSATAACGSYSYCGAWQQYIMSTNAPKSAAGSGVANETNETEVFIEDWLLNYGAYGKLGETCPTGWFNTGRDSILGGQGYDCEQNTQATMISTGQLPITDLADLTLSGSATANGTDEATVTYGGEAYKATVLDSITDIAGVWNQTEFNVVGNGGDSEAQFNNGTSIIVKIAVTDGSMSKPTCVFNSSPTGESNNLNLVSSATSPVCCAYPGSNPSIEFMEVYDTNHTHAASCGSSSIHGEPHITTVNDVYYNFQAAGEFIALLDSDGTEVQTRQTAIPTLKPGDYDPGNKDNDGLFNCLAMNTAVAARVGSHRVTYEPSLSGAYGSGPFELRIDGKVTKLDAKGVELGDGALVKNAPAGGGIEVDFSDGKILAATPSGGYDSMKLLNVQFENLGLLTDDHESAVQGISGDVPKGSWLPALPDGTSVGPMPSTKAERYNTLYHTFGDAWRVTKQNTLFDYAPGTSTDTFTDTKWPVENATTCAIPNKPTLQPVSAAIAEQACKSITNANLHAGCLFDVQATGETHIAETYKASESVHRILSAKPINAHRIVSEAK